MRQPLTLRLRHAVTLAEVLVVLVVLGLLGGMVAVRVPSRPPDLDPSARAHRLAVARLQSLRQGRVIVVVDSSEAGRLWWAAAFPDGSLVADSSAPTRPRVDGAP